MKRKWRTKKKSTPRFAERAKLIISICIVESFNYLNWAHDLTFSFSIGEKKERTIEPYSHHPPLKVLLLVQLPHPFILQNNHFPFLFFLYFSFQLCATSYRIEFTTICWTNTKYNSDDWKGCATRMCCR